MKAYVGFCGSSGIIQKGIIFFRSIAKGKKVWCNHSFPVVRINNEWFTLDADIGGVKLNPLDEMKAKKYKMQIWSFEANDTMLEFVNSVFVNKVVGTKYGYLQFLGMIPVSILQRLGLKIKNVFTTNWICSELSFEYIRRVVLAGTNLYHWMNVWYDSNAISPDNLLDAMIECECELLVNKEIGENDFNFDVRDYHVLLKMR